MARRRKPRGGGPCDRSQRKDALQLDDDDSDELLDEPELDSDDSELELDSEDSEDDELELDSEEELLDATLLDELDAEGSGWVGLPPPHAPSVAAPARAAPPESSTRKSRRWVSRLGSVCVGGSSSL